MTKLWTEQGNSSRGQPVQASTSFTGPPRSEGRHCGDPPCSLAALERSSRAAARCVVRVRCSGRRAADVLDAQTSVAADGPLSTTRLQWWPLQLRVTPRSARRASARSACSLCTTDDQPAASRATENLYSGVCCAPRDRAFRTK